MSNSRLEGFALTSNVFHVAKIDYLGILIFAVFIRFKILPALHVFPDCDTSELGSKEQSLKTDHYYSRVIFEIGVIINSNEPQSQFISFELSNTMLK